uniref:Putative tail collar domain protein n=1 Tax=viral metagenome TaxID=1070528 RepID=A0A6H2A0A0_9ZZZZ
MKFVLNQITGKLDQVELNNISDADAATLTDDSMADTLHRHSELSASDGIPDRALVVDALGNVGIGTTGPVGPLDIVATDATIRLKATSASNWSGVNMYDNNGALAASFQYANAAAAFSNSMFIGTRIAYAPLIFLTGSGENERMRITADGKVGIGTTSPTAVLHLKAGTATAGTAPFKFTISGAVVLTTPEVGVIEPNAADDIFYTITTGVARKGIVLNDGANLTSGKIPIASTNGRLIDGPTPLAGTKVYYVADLSGGAVTRKLTFIDGILTAEI